MPSTDLQTWLGKLPASVRTLRVKKGATPRTLKKVGEVSFPGETEPEERDLDAIVEEISETLEAANYDELEETVGLDALDEKGKAVRTWQNSDAAADLGRDRAPRRAASSDFQALTDLVVETQRSLIRVNANLTGVLRAEREYAWEMRNQAAQAEAERQEAELAAAMLERELESQAEAGEDNVRARGVGALERLAERLAGAAKPNGAALKKAFKEKPDAFDDLLEDPEVVEMIMQRMAKKRGS